jgi:hypothetical protein
MRYISSIQPPTYISNYNQYFFLNRMDVPTLKILFRSLLNNPTLLVLKLQGILSKNIGSPHTTQIAYLSPYKSLFILLF